MVRVDLEWDRIFGPSLADGLERRSPSQRFEVLGEVVSGDEGLHVGLEALQALVMENLDGCVLHGSVHPLGLPVTCRPGR